MADEIVSSIGAEVAGRQITAGELIHFRNDGNGGGILRRWDKRFATTPTSMRESNAQGLRLRPDQFIQPGMLTTGLRRERSVHQ